MDFEIYCDEALPDLFTSKKTCDQFLMIGGLWIPASIRQEVKQKVSVLREQHNVWGEIKWRKVSSSKQEFYEDLVDLFFSYGLDMRFRCIAVDHTRVDMEMLKNDHELGFYKFYYQLLHHWILDFNTYNVFCDTKSTRINNRLSVLKDCLSYANLSSKIQQVQALPSKEIVLIQLCDLLLGIASSRMNGTLGNGTAKEHLVHMVEKKLNISRLRPTYKSEEKFNIFQIDLQGGW